MAIEQSIPLGHAAAVLQGNLSVGTEIFNITFGFSYTAEPWTATDTANLYHDLVDPVESITNVNWTYEKLTVRLQGLAPDLQFFEHLETVQGDAIAASQPANIATLVRKRTNVSGRRHRGRWYWPGLLTDADVDETAGILPAKVSTLQTAFSLVLSNIQGHANVDQMVLLHSYETDPPAPNQAAPTPIGVLAVDNLIATQRRRIARLRS
jgi:hypothetical protein